MLLNISQVSEKVKLGPSTIRKRAASGAFPAGHKMGSRRVWYEEEVTDWIIETLGEPVSKSRSKGKTWLSSWTEKS